MNVVDEARYRRYREAIAPVLQAYGGTFRFDFVVSEVLSEAPAHPVTRVFTIGFRDREASQAFFEDARYLEAKQTHYEGAVDGHTVVAAHHVEE